MHPINYNLIPYTFTSKYYLIFLVISFFFFFLPIGYIEVCVYFSKCLGISQFLSVMDFKFDSTVVVGYALHTLRDLLYGFRYGLPWKIFYTHLKKCIFCLCWVEHSIDVR